MSSGQTIERLSKMSGDPTPEEMKQVLAVLNHLAGLRELHESPEFAGVAGPDATATATWATKILALSGLAAGAGQRHGGQLRRELAEQFDAEKSRRLNKLLIAAVFPDSLRKARLNLLPLTAWRPVKVRFQVLNAQEAFMIWMKAALMTGHRAGQPVCVLSDLDVRRGRACIRTRRTTSICICRSASACFLAGRRWRLRLCSIRCCDFLFTFNKGMNADFDPRIGEWLSFVLILPLGFGISFQLPLVMLFLNRIGVASLEFYIQQWRVAVLMICVISMVLTPADPISMMLMAAPLCVLYLLGIVMCKYMPRGKSPFEEAYEP